MAECNSDLAAQAVALLKQNGLKLCFAESLTGGMISSGIVDVPGASAVFNGAVVSYVNDVKTGVLGVSPDVIAEKTEVSLIINITFAQKPGIETETACGRITYCVMLISKWRKVKWWQ